MSKNDQSAIEDAGKIIERFGGIRPMATKMDIPVTTVQGWKKRGAIPAARRKDVIRAAQDNDVDLSGLIKGFSPANENAQESGKAASPQRRPEAPVQGDKAAERPEEKETISLTSRLDNEKSSGKVVYKSAETEELARQMSRKIADSETSAITKSSFISIVLVALGVAAVIALLWPRVETAERNSRKIAVLENDVEGMKERQSFFSTLIPDDLEARIAALQGQAQQAQEKIGSAIEKAEQISADVLGGNAGNLENRIIKLEEHVTDITGSDRMAALLQRFRQMSGSIAGQEQLERTMQELSALVSGLQGREEGLDEVLHVARQEDTAIRRTFEGVPQEDLKAAALLLGLTQFRQSLNRNNTPFDEDLNLLLNLVGEDNTTLRGSLEKLAPQAQEGVLTTEGLTSEFRSLAGEAVVASLKGEDVSLQERAQARLNDIFRVEKDGELVSGTPAQAAVAKAETLLEQGDVAGAMAEVQTLDGEALALLQPWLEKAKAVLNAQNAKAVIDQAISYSASGSVTGSRLYRDEKSGITILKGPPTLKNLEVESR